MAVTVKEDLLRDAAVTSTTSEQTIVRGFLVSGLGDLAASSQPLLAETATDATSGVSVPPMFAPHPSKPEAIVTRLVTKALGDGCFYVAATYAYKILPVAYLQSFRASFRQVPTHFDAADSRALVSYTPTGGSQASQVANLTRSRLSATLSFEIVESVSPEAATTANSGNTNDAAWRGYAAGTVLCLPVQGETRDGVNYRNTYSFAYDPATWDEYAFYVDSSTGRVPSDVAPTLITDGSSYSGNGWGRFVMYPQIDFSTAFPQFS